MGELRAGYELIPDRLLPEGSTAELPRFQIEGTLGAGGFGITYLAAKAPMKGPSEADFSQMLWLPADAKVAVKEFYPEQFAYRLGSESEVRPHSDEEKAEHFDLFLNRFRKEAERLFLLTCLRALRAIEEAPADRIAKADREHVERIDAFLERVAKGDTTDLVADALDLIAGFDAVMRGIALETFARSPLPVVYDYFEANGTAYYVMEYLDGGSLKELTGKARGAARTPLPAPWPYERFVPFAEKVLEGLGELHGSVPGQPLIHCDIKPGNIMFRGSGTDRPVLIDVGLARSTSAGEGDDEDTSYVPAYTQRYASLELEQEVTRLIGGGGRGGQIGRWTDIYSAAIVFIELATTAKGEIVPSVSARRKDAARKIDTLARIAHFPPDYPPRFKPAILMGLEIQPQDRPQNVARWARELDLRGPAGGKEPPQPDEPDDDDPTKVVTPPEPVMEGFERRLLLPLSAAGAVVIGAAVAGWIIWSHPQPPPPSEQTKIALSSQDAPLSSPSSPGGKTDAGRSVQQASKTTSQPPSVQADATGSDSAKTPPASKDAVVQPPKMAVDNAVFPPPSENQPPAPVSSAQAVTPISVDRLGMEIRSIVSRDRLASLQTSSHGPAVGSVAVFQVRDGGAAARAGVSGGTRFVRSCSGGSAFDELSAARSGGTACVIDQDGKRIMIGGNP